ncbi:MAG: hypothetical protein ACRC62_36110, partial [Microcoleus sp.]
YQSIPLFHQQPPEQHSLKGRSQPTHFKQRNRVLTASADRDRIFRKNPVSYPHIQTKETGFLPHLSAAIEYFAKPPVSVFPKFTKYHSPSTVNYQLSTKNHDAIHFQVSFARH